MKRQTKKRPVRFAHEMEGQGSAVLSLMRLMECLGEDIPMTRDEWLATNRGWGDTPDPIDESFMPEQFQRKTLIETPPVSDKEQ